MTMPPDQKKEKKKKFITNLQMVNLVTLLKYAETLYKGLSCTQSVRDNFWRVKDRLLDNLEYILAKFKCPLELQQT